MLAVIPARGGSKGVLRKNVKDLNGKPLIAYTIEAALESNDIEQVIVTTDDEEIASVAKQYGAEVPFMRPAHLATDTASAVDVYLHAADYMRENFQTDVSKFMVLLPTAPMRKAKHIDEALELFRNTRADTLVSMKEADIPPSWYFSMKDDGMVKNAGFESGFMANRQVNKKYYIPNGAIYILDYELLETKRSYYSERTVAYVMNVRESIDIDTVFDFQMAELLIKNRDK